MNVTEVAKNFFEGKPTVVVNTTGNESPIFPETIWTAVFLSLQYMVATGNCTKDYLINGDKENVSSLVADALYNAAMDERANIYNIRNNAPNIAPFVYDILFIFMMCDGDYTDAIESAPQDYLVTIKYGETDLWGVTLKDE